MGILSQTDIPISKPCLVTYDTDPNHPGVSRLVKSTRLWGWDLFMLHDPVWRGFGRKYKEIVKKCHEVVATTDYTHALSIDARDFIAVGPPSEFVAPKVPLLISCERGCWPDGDRAKDYPECPTPWKYVNSPFTIDLKYLWLLSTDIQDWEDDQRHITNIYFNSEEKHVELDYRCDIIQSVAFCLPEWQQWFEIEDKRVLNKLTGSKPLLLHANGGTETGWWEPLL